ncbi:hypothetical protein [Aquiflexum balticum]|nr:hypothetical protein [Aquiflexum balticum]
MKHFLNIYALIFLFHLGTFGQSVQCYSDQSDIYWLIGSQHGSKRLSECDIDAVYNCHGFTMAMMENTCSSIPSCCTVPSWNTTVNTPYQCPNNKGIDGGTWRSDSKYVRINSEADARIVFFEINSPGGHSAVKTTSPFASTKYISKYGTDGPLVAHDLNKSFYHLTNRYIPNSMEYWTYIGSIQGNEIIEIGSLYNYSVQAVSGVTYSWASVNSKFNIVSGNGTTIMSLSKCQAEEVSVSK